AFERARASRAARPGAQRIRGRSDRRGVQGALRRQRAGRYRTSLRTGALRRATEVQSMANMNNFVKKAQAEVAQLEVTGESGGGMVKVVMTGRHEVKRVQIEPSIVAEDREMLEDLIAAAVNDAVHRIESATQAKMAAAMGGLSLPPGVKLPF